MYVRLLNVLAVLFFSVQCVTVQDTTGVISHDEGQTASNIVENHSFLDNAVDDTTLEGSGFFDNGDQPGQYKTNDNIDLQDNTNETVNGGDNKKEIIQNNDTFQDNTNKTANGDDNEKEMLQSSGTTSHSDEIKTGVTLPTSSSSVSLSSREKSTTKSSTSTSTSTTTSTATTSPVSNTTSSTPDENHSIFKAFDLNYLYALFLLVPLLGIIFGVHYYCKRKKKKQDDYTDVNQKSNKTRRFSTPSWVFSEPDFDDEEVVTLQEEKK